MDDVGVFSEGFVSLGCIIKNHDKEVSMAPCRKEVVSVKPIVIEMLAIRWSLMLAPDLKLERILVQFLLSKFKVAYVMYFPRTLNYDARKLLGLGKLYGSRTWIGGYPTTESIVVVSALVSS
ncbi:hypothetical protein KIW84_031808 [Lathyrus oleraceus]|uniref:Uncharacterized protein n=1 Tax=Pisum sativum TaxID=3888 RepID=A0A9D5B134_PEA|nr:hypothetical protein KIW84_031808 [Pisum sativum]